MEMKQGIAEKGVLELRSPQEFPLQRFGVPGRGNPAKARVDEPWKIRGIQPHRDGKGQLISGNLPWRSLMFMASTPEAPCSGSYP